MLGGAAAVAAAAAAGGGGYCWCWGGGAQEMCEVAVDGVLVHSLQGVGELGSRLNAPRPTFAAWRHPQCCSAG